MRPPGGRRSIEKSSEAPGVNVTLSGFVLDAGCSDLRALRGPAGGIIGALDGPSLLRPFALRAANYCRSLRSGQSVKCPAAFG